MKFEIVVQVETSCLTSLFALFHESFTLATPSTLITLFDEETKAKYTLSFFLQVFCCVGSKKVVVHCEFDDILEYSGGVETNACCGSCSLIYFMLLSVFVFFDRVYKTYALIFAEINYWKIQF